MLMSTPDPQDDETVANEMLIRLEQLVTDKKSLAMA